jgi:hypothetical protein
MVYPELGADIYLSLWIRPESAPDQFVIIEPQSSE